MIKFKNLGSIRLSTIAKVCVLLTLILVIVGISIGVSRMVQTTRERDSINAINTSLEQQGASLKTKNLVLAFISKYNQTQNIVITDKEDNIVYSANKNIINGMNSFVLEPDYNLNGIFKLKDSTVKFAANPRSIVPFIQRDNGVLQGSNNNIYNYNGRMHGFNGNKQGMRNMMNGGFYNRQNNEIRDRYDGPGRDGFRITRFMGPGMMNGMPNGRFGANQNTLFLTSYKADANGLNIFYISKRFEQNNLMTVMFITMAMIKLLTLLLYVLLAAWVYKDSKTRGLKAVFWGLLTLFTGLIGLIIYLIIKYTTNFCHTCSNKINKEDNFCIKCGAGQKVKCAKCGENVRFDSNYCVNCGEKQEEK